jgi:hypothetical protein
MTRSQRPIACATIALTLAAGGDVGAATLTAQTLKAWSTYVAATEARIGRELSAASAFLTSDFTPDAAAVRGAIGAGGLQIAKLETRDASGKAIAVPDGSITHWRGAVLLPGVSLEALLHRLQHPPEHGPHPQDVLAMRVLDRQSDRLRLAIRMTRSAIVTATYDTEHTIQYQRHGPTRASSRSVSNRILEVDGAGTDAERTLPEGQDRGFLWRMNSYWRYEQVTDGVIVELESLTLSRGIPIGFGMIVEPTVDRIARESISRTLESVRRLYGSGTARRGTIS